MTDTTTLPEFEILRAGRYADASGKPVEITPADLAAMAAGYDPALGEVPLVIGHPASNAPAYGWADRLVARGNVLLATAKQVMPAFAAALRAGHFKKRSASIFPAGHPSNPKPGQMYLRHIGWLGGAAPAIPGLRDVQFAGPSSLVVTAELNMSETDPTIDLAAQQAALTARETSIKAREEALAAAEAKAARTGVIDFCAGLVKAGKLLPAEQPAVVELLVQIEGGQPKPLNFAAPDGTQASKPPGTVLRDLLGALPERTPMGEIAGVTADVTAAAPLNFSAPQGVQVQADRMQLHNKALEYQRTHPNTSYVDAVRAVGG